VLENACDLEFHRRDYLLLSRSAEDFRLNTATHCGGARKIVAAMLVASEINKILDHHGFDYRSSFRCIQKMVYLSGIQQFRGLS